jgi:steroid delta-isomerase-like uncharacterized protein
VNEGMVEADNKTLAQRFVQTVFNEGKIDETKNFVTPDISYHGVEEVKGVENFKQLVGDDRRAFPDLNITILDAFGEKDKLAMRWTLKGTFSNEFAGVQPTNEKFETQGVEIFYFQDGKIKEAWTIFGSMENFK